MYKSEVFLSNEAITRDILKYFLCQRLRFNNNNEKKNINITAFIEIFLKIAKLGSKSRYHTLLFILKNNLLNFNRDGIVKEQKSDTKL